MKKTELLDEELKEINGGIALKEETLQSVLLNNAEFMGRDAEPLQNIRLEKVEQNLEAMHDESLSTNAKQIENNIGFAKTSHGRFSAPVDILTKVRRRNRK